MQEKQKVLLIYTGGTIGMRKNPETGSLMPVNFEGMQNSIPELGQLEISYDVISTKESKDSSDMTADDWVEMATVIHEHYSSYCGFVILHGSDTLAFTASALSFMFENLDKPIILTGSQLPMGVPRTDARENLITSLEIASSYENGLAMIPEVAVYFEYKLYRGNRVSKLDAERFDAFGSYNYPPLAEAGVNMMWKRDLIHHPLTFQTIKLNTALEKNIISIKLFPGIDAQFYQNLILDEKIKGIVIETFGAGNIGNKPEWTALLKKAINQGKVIVNISQCLGGSVEQGKYEASRELQKIGVISGGEMSYEATICKLMHVLAQPISHERKKEIILKNIRGER
ncbi:MAG: asparaginase [Flavobacteriales bacterium]|jgi:L-asparaginase|nr:asparaginase [Flavobacteriales bacterium]